MGDIHAPCGAGRNVPFDEVGRTVARRIRVGHALSTWQTACCVKVHDHMPPCFEWRLM